MFEQNEFKVTERDFSMKEVTKALKENRVSSTCVHFKFRKTFFNLVSWCW